jgi:uncharacterized protein YndB with AHSA1/START domain
VEDVFRALSDVSRRQLLDRLFERDGQSLTELASGMAMTRFGVMKHLDILEGAGLVTTSRAGRQKLHYLNPVPIRLVYDRWVSKFAEPWVAAMTGLKAELEAETMAAPKQVYEVYIRTTPQRLWEALTDGAITQQYFHATRAESEWKVGSPVCYWLEDGQPAVEGTVLEADPPRRLSITWSFRYDPAMAAETPSRVTFEIEQRGPTCLLRTVHDDFPEGSIVPDHVSGGWPFILSNLKSLLETGSPLLVGA